MSATHLADVSALAQLHHSDVAAQLGPLLVGGGVATCGLVDLDLLAMVARTDEYLEVLEERRLFPRVPVDDQVLDRAMAVGALLAADGVPSPTALIVAAAAERAGLVLLHHDPDLARIAAVTDQPVEHVGPSFPAGRGGARP